MEHSYMTSVLQSHSEVNNNQKRANRSCESNNQFYLICVVDFDGEYLDFTVEASSYSQANAIADSYCESVEVYIYEMQIYLLN
ncbi:MAG: hypothetical protein RR061_06190 [Muribaculaceae bacterium]